MEGQATLTLGLSLAPVGTWRQCDLPSYSKWQVMTWPSLPRHPCRVAYVGGHALYQLRGLTPCLGLREKLE